MKAFRNTLAICKRLVGQSLLLLLAVSFVAPLPALATVTNQSLAVPLYNAPAKNSYWNDIRAAGSSSVPFVVANPANGPGVTATTEYQDALAKNDTAGMKTLGYVQTNFQARPFKDVYKDVDSWYRLYPNTKGILIDLVKEGAAADVCYVASLYSHIKNARPNDLVVLAPGTHLSEAYEPYGDIFMNAASDYGTYQNWKPQYKGFEDKLENQNRFWHVVHGVSSQQYTTLFQMLRANNAGWVYVTDKNTPTPYAATPAFWQSETSDVTALPPSNLPNRGKTFLPRGCISLGTSAVTIVDTTAAKQASSKSSFTVSNTSTTYNSDATTSVQFVGLPKGVSVQGMSGSAWACDVSAKTCTYAALLPASNAAPPLATNLQTNCEYAGGEATLRTTNYTGNRWDTNIPLKPPFGCEAGTPAQRLNTGTSGLVQTITTLGTETTPANTALAPQAAPELVDKKAEAAPAKLSAGKIIAIIFVLLLVIGIVIWLVYRAVKRRRYGVNI